MSEPLVRPHVEMRGGKQLQEKLRKIAEAAHRAHGSYVSVGWQGDARYPSGVRVAQVAIFNEFGTYTARHRVHTPARPFMRPVMAEKKQVIAELCQSSLAAVALQGWTVAKGLQRIGFQVREMLANRIRSNTPPPLADSTEQARRRHGRGTNTLIDTGKMLETLDFVLHLKGEAVAQHAQEQAAEAAKAERMAQLGRDVHGHFLTRAAKIAQIEERSRPKPPTSGRDEHGRFIKKS